MLIQIIYWKDPYEEFKSLVSTYLTILCSDELYANPNHNKNKYRLKRKEKKQKSRGDILSNESVFFG